MASLAANKTAQIVQAGTAATFVVTAVTSAGKPAVNQPVTFYIGPMVPLSGIPPKHWYASGTPQGNAYISSFTRMTNNSGQATLVLKAQPTKSMEMVGVRIGNLSSYSTSQGKALGSLDAWWTTPTTSPTAPVGDWVTLSPWVTNSPANQTVPLTVMVNSPTGPVAGATVSFAMKGGMGSTSRSSMSSSGGVTRTTGSSGQVVYSVKTGAMMAMTPIRIVVSSASTMMRVSGGMNAELISR
ncbi:MAG: hypothetical protein M0Z53_02880 [Thermaerobacter sp.]|nr:hypothetical protein [Thermaerobacter sp.]